jgi:subtilisin family serine protease
MKRSMVLLLVLGLVATSALTGTAAAKKKAKARVIEYHYQVPSPAVSGVVGACVAGNGVDTGCNEIATSVKERYVTVKVTDASGQPTNWYLAQDTDAANQGLEIFASGCGETSGPVAITPGLALRVQVGAVGGPDCPGVATTGDVTVTLSSKP